MNSKIELILQKYFKGKASEAELSSLKNWMSIGKNKKVFQEYVEIQYLLDYKFKEFNFEKAEKQFNLILNKKSVISLNKKRRYKSLLKYAAIFVGLLGLSFFIKNQFFTSNTLISEDAITIQLDNGNIEVITDLGERKILDKNGNVVGAQKGSTLDYNNEFHDDVSKVNTEVLVYNELNIPYGKTFKVLLSDGTIVHLNAGTSLKYPVKFLEGKSRKIFLKGEAHFNVAKDAKHPFIVNTNNINVRALGTQFNVSSYTEDNQISTVLVEGSVGVYNNEEKFNINKSLILKPGQKADWNKTEKRISTSIVNTNIYTGWIDGKLIFNHMSFSNIRKILERHYNVSIINNNTPLESEVFTATFDIETIEQVLASFNKNYSINYNINNNNITIN